MTKVAPIEIQDAGQGVTHLYRGDKRMGSIFDDGSLCSLKTGGMQETFRNKRDAINAITKTFGPVIRRAQKRLSPDDAIALEARIARLVSRIGSPELDPNSPRRITPDDILEIGIKVTLGANASPTWFDRIKRMMVNEVLRGEGVFVPSAFDRLPERNRILMEAVEAVERSQKEAEMKPLEMAFKVAIETKAESHPTASPSDDVAKESPPEPQTDLTYASADPIDAGLASIFDIPIQPLPASAPVGASSEAETSKATPEPSPTPDPTPVAHKPRKQVARQAMPEQEPIQYAYTRGTRLTRSEVNEIRRRIIAKEETMKAAAKRLNISSGMITKIVDGRYKTAD